MVSVVATGEASERKLRERGFEPGVIQSSVSTRKGRTTTKKTFSSVDGSVTRIDEVTREPGKTITKVSSRDLAKEEEDKAIRDAIAKRVVSDLNASARADALREQERINASFRFQEENKLFNPLVGGVVSSAERLVKESEGGKSSAMLDVEQNVRFSQLTGSPLSVDYLRSSREGREFLLDNSDTLNRILSSPSSKSLFLNTDDSAVSKLPTREKVKAGVKSFFSGAGDVIRSGNVRDIVQYPFVKVAGAGVKSAVVINELAGVRRENIAILRDEKARAGFVPESSLIQDFVSVGQGVRVGVVNPDNIRESEEVSRSTKNILGVVAGDVRAGIGYAKGVEVVKDDSFDFKSGLINSFKTGEGIKLFAPRKVVFPGVPSPSESSGLGMIGYTGGSVITNKIPVVGKFGTEVVDVGLAVPDYARAIINPTPSNKAGAVVELIDVAVDFIPFGGVNADTNYNVLLDSDVNSADVRHRGGVGRSSFDGSVSGELRVSSSGEIGFVNSNESEVGIGNSLYDAVTRVGSSAEVGFNVSNNVVADLSKGNLNRSEVGFDFPVSSEVGFDNNVDVDVDFAINDNFNSDFNTDLNVDFNNNLNNNFESNVNTNFDTNFNFNYDLNFDNNFNFNLNFSSKDRASAVLSGGSYSAFAKVKGKFIRVASPVSSKREAFKIGGAFVEGNSSRQFGVSDNPVSFNRGLNVSSSGVFRRKKSRKGFTFIEPSSFAINSPGEFREITRKGILSKKNKGLKL